MSKLSLSTAQAQWVADENDNQWKVVDENQNVLGFIPAGNTDRGVMQILNLGREFEDKAYKLGIEDGKQAAMAAGRIALTRQKAQIEQLETMNERLSEQLERHIIGQDEEL